MINNKSFIIESHRYAFDLVWHYPAKEKNVVFSSRYVKFEPWDIYLWRDFTVLDNRDTNRALFNEGVDL